MRDIGGGVELHELGLLETLCSARGGLDEGALKDSGGETIEGPIDEKGVAGNLADVVQLGPKQLVG